MSYLKDVKMDGEGLLRSDGPSAGVLSARESF